MWKVKPKESEERDGEEIEEIWKVLQQRKKVIWTNLTMAAL